MEMHDISDERSKAINGMGHDGVNTMRVRYGRGAEYDFSPVTPEKAQEIYDSPSPGAALARLGITGTLYEPEKGE